MADSIPNRHSETLRWNSGLAEVNLSSGIFPIVQAEYHRTICSSIVALSPHDFRCQQASDGGERQITFGRTEQAMTAGVCRSRLD